MNFVGIDFSDHFTQVIFIETQPPYPSIWWAAQTPNDTNDFLERAMTLVSQIPNPTTAQPVPQMPTYDARDLVQTGAQACIVLDGQTYYLRITRAGKLILTK